METFISKVFSLCTNMKCLSLTDFDVKFGPEPDFAVNDIQEDIVLATRLKNELLKYQDDLVRAESAQNARVQQMTYAENGKTKNLFSL